MFKLIVARDEDYGIGLNNALLYNEPNDMKYFKSKTNGEVVVMGSATFESLGCKPLPDRINIVLSSSKTYPDTNTFTTIDRAIQFLNKTYKDKIWWLIGGATLYKQFLELNLVSEIHITQIAASRRADVYFSYQPIEHGFSVKETHSLSALAYVMVYTKRNKEELQLLDTMREIMDKGHKRMDRTGVGTRSVFGKMFKYKIHSIRKHGKDMYSIPMLTTKKMFIRGVFEELMWFLRGQTDSKILESKQVNIWKLNSTREFLDNRGLETYPEGECGPIYGYQWRRWGADPQMAIEGIDQVHQVIESLTSNPYSRRHIISGWNVSDLNKMCLPPCFVRDTPVLTKKGFKMIQDVDETDELYSHRARWQPIVNLQMSQYQDHIFEIYTAIHSSPIQATKEHPFLVCAKRVPDETNPARYTNPFWIEAKQLRQGYHMLCTPLSQTREYPDIEVQINKDTVYSRPLVDADSMYMMGYYLASRCPRLRRVHAGESRIQSDFIMPPAWSILTELDKEDLPYWMYDLPVHDIYEFLKGYGANNVHKDQHGQEYMPVHNEQLAMSLQLLYAKAGIAVKICTHDSKLVMRKIDGAIIDHQYMLTDILDIKQLEPKTQMVYNFEVENDNSYCVQNIAVHNCHVLYQFMVHEQEGRKHLSLMMTQRSCDTFLGLPFNISSLGLFLILMAKRVNMIPHEIIHSIADMHIYETHISAATKQIAREPLQFPYILVKTNRDNIEDYQYEDIELHHYFCYDAIKAPMAA